LQKIDRLLWVVSSRQRQAVIGHELAVKVVAQIS
jgi:hypothetical protein